MRKSNTLWTITVCEPIDIGREIRPPNLFCATNNYLDFTVILIATDIVKIYQISGG